MNTSETPAIQQEHSLWQRLNMKLDIRAYTMIIALILIWIIFSILTEGRFLIPRNLSNLSRQMSITAVLAIGMVMVIVANHIDLSVGSVLGLTGGIAAVLQVWYHLPTPLVIIISLALGALIGLWHGYWIAYQKVPAFIVTLAGYMAYRGILLGAIKGLTVAPMFPDFKAISSGYLDLVPGLILTGVAIAALIYGRIRSRLSKLKYGFKVNHLFLDILITLFYCGLIITGVYILYQYEGIPYPIIFVLALTIIFTFITNKTKFGRQVYAIGGNIEAARLSGINVRRCTLMIFVLASLLAAIAGILTTARLNAATTTAGTGAELDAIASCVIGGTSFSGGVGSIPGAILGALVMASLDNGMSMMNAEAFWQYIVKGFVLLLAVWMDIKTKK
ncbi:MAG TPA: sugar ABC transporter permease [Bacillota bacterium]|nr:sugar ABC transporter permease [Bacillota bacterium]HPT88314.1 sugar ABC transporter permease [Bacillota bacterium]